MENQKKIFLYLKSCLAIFIIQFLVTGCEKEEVSDPLSYKDFTSVIGSEAKSVTFYSNYSNIPDEFFPTLHFPDQCFTQKTRITLGYTELFGSRLPDSLVTVTSDCRYLWYFNAENTEPSKSVQVSIPYPDDLSEKLLQRYEHLFKLYRISKDADPGEAGNFEELEEYKLDIVKNRVEFSVDNFDYGYAILFPEIKRLDHVIVHASNELLVTFANNTLSQHLRAYDYFSEERETGKGFHQDRGVSNFSIVDYWGTQSHLKLSFAGTEPGTYAWIYDDVAIKFQAYAILGLDEFDPRYVYNFEETVSTVITITEYGDIGEFVEGSISGPPYESYYHEYVDFYIYFRVKRLR